MNANIFMYKTLVPLFAIGGLVTSTQAQFTFKKLSSDDIPQLLVWFDEPHVNKWWPVLSKDETIEHFLKRIRSKDTFGYIVSIDNTPIGYIQYYYIDRTVEKAGSWLPELPKTTVGTDQFIGDPNYIGKGYGTQFVKAFIDYLRSIEPTITTIIVDPEPDNHGAIRCYERVGFKRVGEFATRYGHALLMRYDRT